MVPCGPSMRTGLKKKKLKEGRGCRSGVRGISKTGG